MAREADRLGYAVAWAAEAYGSDAATVLSWIAAQTTTIDVGAAIFQIPGRTPANCAMTAATLDTLSGGRFRLGLGVSGPQVSEGWHGVRFDKPLARTREYVDIVRMALRRERVSYDGEFWQLPLPDGPGKSLTLTVHPVRDSLPIYLAAIGPKNLELCGEIADGWLAIFFSPEDAAGLMEPIVAGRAKVDKTLDGFDVVPTVPVVPGKTSRRAQSWCAPTRRCMSVAWAARQELYNQLMSRMGYEQAAIDVQDKYMNKDYAGAAAAVPFEFLDKTSLLGPPERIGDRLHAYAEAGVTTLSIGSFAGTIDERVGTLRMMSQVLEASGLAD